MFADFKWIVSLLKRKPPDCHHEVRTAHRCHFGYCPPCKQVCLKKLSKCEHTCPALCHTAILARIEEKVRWHKFFCSALETGKEQSTRQNSTFAIVLLGQMKRLFKLLRVWSMFWHAKNKLGCWHCVLFSLSLFLQMLFPSGAASWSVGAETGESDWDGGEAMPAVPSSRLSQLPRWSWGQCLRAWLVRMPKVRHNLTADLASRTQRYTVCQESLWNVDD